MGNKPIASFKSEDRKGLEISAWEGKYGVSFSIQKRYYDKKDEEWKDSKLLFEEDFKELTKLHKEALDWLATYRAEREQVTEDAQTFSAGTAAFEDDDIPF